ncbi:MAG: hypothetical protein JW742_05820 [Candidatus Aminicenantes bacterium]|nr:hypothetical protein [Candidatus Aminicenantes bacterium]
MSPVSPFFDPPLPFPIKLVSSAMGPVQIYEIPDDQKEAILKQLYIFSPVPSLDDVMEDIHAEKRFRVREFLVAREGEMNVLASPYSLEAGGTVIDWMPVRRARKRASKVASSSKPDALG